MQGMDVNRYTRVCAYALITLIHLTQIFRLRTFLSLSHVVFRSHAQPPCDKREETLVFPPTPIVGCHPGVRENKEKKQNCGYVFLLIKSLWAHIAADMLSGMCMCAWYIVIRRVLKDFR